MRRREVIRLRLGKRMTVEEIAEETGYSESTVRRDFKWINGQVDKLQDPEVIKDFLMESAVHLMDHETEDLRRADRENDEKAKHRAKQSMRSTMKMLEEFTEGNEVQEEDVQDEEYIESLPENVQEEISEHAESEVEALLDE